MKNDIVGTPLPPEGNLFVAPLGHRELEVKFLDDDNTIGKQLELSEQQRLEIIKNVNNIFGEAERKNKRQGQLTFFASYKLSKEDIDEKGGQR